MPFDDQLKLIASLCGIDPEYRDIWGRRHRVSDHTQKKLLKAMGIRIDNRDTANRSLSELQDRSWLRWLEPVLVISECVSSISISISLPRSLEKCLFQWVLQKEDGRRHHGHFFPSELEHIGERKVNGASYVRHSFPLPVQPGMGYHRWQLLKEESAKGEEAAMPLIVVPSQCYLPSGLEGNGRAWGPAVQLYALRSRRNWGMGDFTDLTNLVAWSAQAGAGLIGVNPLHAIFPDNPSSASPYSPSSRCFLNIFYLDVQAVPDFSESQTARAMFAAPEFQSRLRKLREAELVDYEGVAEAKFCVLEVLWRHFHEHHRKRKTRRAEAFKEFQSQGGISLERQALFEALQEHFQKKDPCISNRFAWPQDYHDPESAAVQDFALAHSRRVEFFQYLQWQADVQLREASEHSSRCGLSVGIYRDLAVGIDKGGAEAWANPWLYALDAGIGAPPDAFNLRGQDWGLPPMVPDQLREQAYRPFIDTLRNNMRHAGALRIDHVMGLMRLYWVPAGASPAEGAYVHYPFHDLMGILALESRRNRCMVIGEDLGTVPVEVRRAMEKWGVLSYRLLYFERTGEGGGFTPPGDYPRDALAAITTHDLPTLGGFWRGRDIEVRTQMDLFPNKEIREEQIKERELDRAGLLECLRKEDLLPEGICTSPLEMSHKLLLAIHRFLSRTPCKLLTFQLEDILGQVEQINMPGTIHHYPNWRRKSTLNLEDFAEDFRLKELCAELLRSVLKKSR